MSAVFCGHPTVQPYGPGGFLVCGLCGSEWYAMDKAPIKVLGYTTSAEVDPFPYLLETRKRREKEGL